MGKLEFFTSLLEITKSIDQDHEFKDVFKKIRSLFLTQINSEVRNCCKVCPDLRMIDYFFFACQKHLRGGNKLLKEFCNFLPEKTSRPDIIHLSIFCQLKDEGKAFEESPGKKNQNCGFLANLEKRIRYNRLVFLRNDTVKLNVVAKNYMKFANFNRDCCENCEVERRKDILEWTKGGSVNINNNEIPSELENDDFVEIKQEIRENEDNSLSASILETFETSDTEYSPVKDDEQFELRHSIPKLPVKECEVEEGDIKEKGPQKKSRRKRNNNASKNGRKVKLEQNPSTKMEKVDEELFQVEDDEFMDAAENDHQKAAREKEITEERDRTTVLGDNLRPNSKTAGDNDDAKEDKSFYGPVKEEITTDQESAKCYNTQEGEGVNEDDFENPISIKGSKKKLGRLEKEEKTTDNVEQNNPKKKARTKKKMSTEQEELSGNLQESKNNGKKIGFKIRRKKDKINKQKIGMNFGVKEAIVKVERFDLPKENNIEKKMTKALKEDHLYQFLDEKMEKTDKEYQEKLDLKGQRGGKKSKYFNFPVQYSSGKGVWHKWQANDNWIFRQMCGQQFECSDAYDLANKIRSHMKFGPSDSEHGTFGSVTIPIFEIAKRIKGYEKQGFKPNYAIK